MITKCIVFCFVLFFSSMRLALLCFAVSCELSMWLEFSFKYIPKTTNRKYFDFNCLSVSVYWHTSMWVWVCVCRHCTVAWLDSIIQVDFVLFVIQCVRNFTMLFCMFCDDRVRIRTRVCFTESKPHTLSEGNAICTENKGRITQTFSSFTVVFCFFHIISDEWKYDLILFSFLFSVSLCFIMYLLTFCCVVALLSYSSINRVR